MRRLLVLIIIVLVVGGFIIANTLNLDLKKSEDKKILAKETFSWLKKLGNNFRALIGLAIKQDWAPEVNKSEIDKARKVKEEEKDGKKN